MALRNNHTSNSYYKCINSWNTFDTLQIMFYTLKSWLQAMYWQRWIYIFFTCEKMITNHAYNISWKNVPIIRFFCSSFIFRSLHGWDTPILHSIQLYTPFSILNFVTRSREFYLNYGGKLAIFSNSVEIVNKIIMKTEECHH